MEVHSILSHVLYQWTAFAINGINKKTIKPERSALI